MHHIIEAAFKGLARCLRDAVRHAVRLLRSPNRLRALVAEGALSMLVFDHVGITAHEPQPGEDWVEQSRCWVTNPRNHPEHIEFLRETEADQKKAKRAKRGT